MKPHNIKTMKDFCLIFLALMLLQPGIAILFDVPSSLYVYKQMADFLGARWIEEEGRYLVAVIALIVVILLYISKYRPLALKLSLVMFIGAIISHIVSGIQLPYFGDAQTSMYGMIDTGDFFNAVAEARNHGFTREEVLLSPNGYKMFVPQGYDSGFSFVLYSIAFALNVVLLKFIGDDKHGLMNSAVEQK
ncbi:hypothetical protein [Shewanella sp. NIFS-20-20]|uniref:hypothetical protein n=1 Tax=Shewanella sp. NIFS-20-20 TaxID=2853806 RepID=UPI001C48F8F1|nr:hypothetical protein [Shewanella sp. NIFS-20-20]MBV7316366.1 hypothetical protein [Shewanella sp. NIFS-20-20]